jgi:hypothetical protein
MKKVLTLAIVLLAISVITPGFAYAAALRTQVTGTYSMTGTALGDQYFLNSGILRIVGAEASGTISSSDSRLTGTLEIVLNQVFNLNNGEGVGFGSFKVSNAAGTFEGRFTAKDTSYVLFEGKVEGYGTGAYEGLLVKLDMSGSDWYLDANSGTNGIEATFTGSILSP